MNFEQLFSDNPAKRRTERYWLYYTPVWGMISAVVMVGGFAERWGDWQLMVYGFVLAAGAIAGPLWIRGEDEFDTPWYQRTSVKLMFSVVGLSFGLNYTQTPYFYDVLHMHYGFNTNINIRNNPVFLYFVTVAYFSTYCALTMMSFRAFRRLFGMGSAAGRVLAYLLAPIAMAFLETALNANPFIRGLFCYDDLNFMLWFGTLSYGVAFILALPLWIAIDETPGDKISMWSVVLWLGAVLYADLVMLDLLRYNVAPHFTTVVEGAQGLGDFGNSCLGLPIGG